MKSTASTTWASAILAATESALRSPGKITPPALIDGQPLAEADQDLRILHVAELLRSEEWQGVRTLRLLMEAWKCSLRDVDGYAAEARKRLRREFGIGDRPRMLVGQVAALERLAGKAESAGAYSAAVAARRAILATAPAPVAPLATGRSLSAEGLPPELAKLKNPSATPQEVAHFAEVDEAACTYTGCRVHPRAEGAAVSAPVVEVARTGAGSTPMH